MKTKTNISDFEAKVLKTIREKQEETFIRAIEMCIDMVEDEAKKYEKLAYSKEGLTIRNNSIGIKYWRMTAKSSSIINKATLLWTISGKLYDIIHDIREKGLKIS